MYFQRACVENKTSFMQQGLELYLCSVSLQNGQLLNLAFLQICVKGDHNDNCHLHTQQNKSRLNQTQNALKQVTGILKTLLDKPACVFSHKSEMWSLKPTVNIFKEVFYFILTGKFKETQEVTERRERKVSGKVET